MQFGVMTMKAQIERLTIWLLVYAKRLGNRTLKQFVAKDIALSQNHDFQQILP